MEWRQMVKSVEDSWSGWMWGHWVFHRLKTGKLSLESERENDFINCMGELMKFRRYEAHGPRRSSDKTVLTVNKYICPKVWLNHIIEKKKIFFLTLNGLFFVTSFIQEWSVLSLVEIHSSDMSIIQKCLTNQLAADEIIIVSYCPTH